MSITPKISVVMTVYNGERFVKEAIDSILSQTFTDFEFIIVDNASADSTCSIISEYKDRRIKLIKNKDNLGQTKALNIGILSSSGEFIARMDADDISLPERLQIQYNFITKDKSLAVVGAWHKAIDEVGRSIRKIAMPTDPFHIKCYLISPGALTYYCISHPTVLIRKKVLDEAGLYNEQYLTQDYELWLRISRKFKLANVAKVLLKHRVYESSQTLSEPEAFEVDKTAIVGDNIKYYLPDISSKDFSILQRMLCFRPQVCSDDGKKVINLFDKFFSSVVNGYPVDNSIRDKIKLFYMPLLFFSNKMNALRITSMIIRKNPSFLLDKKVYRKIIKVFACN